MSTNTNPLSPRLLKGGIVTMDPDTSVIQAVISFQYNPETVTRTLQIQSVPGSQDGNHVDVLRLRGPAIEALKVDVELDAADYLEFPSQYPLATQFGLQPQLAQLEMLVNPSVETLLSDDQMASAGTLEIIPLEQPLTLFVWSTQRVMPVRLTEFSIAEEAFDPNLNPIRAKVSLGMRVLNVDDLGFDHPGGRMYLTYLTNKETMAGRVANAALTTLGIGS
jgi:hypothetical protein